MIAQASLTDRMLRAAKGDVHLYEEVERDTNATSQAATVVIIVAVLSAIGAAVAATMLPASMVIGGQTIAVPRNPIGTFVQQLIAVPIGWILWSYVTYFVGTRLFGGTATPGEMMRCIGFAYSPQVLSILQVVPVLGGIVSLVLFVWSIWLAIVAIRQALDFSTGKAVGTAVVGAIVAFVAIAIVGAIVGLITAPFAMAG
jgi:hypothetical protein